MVRGQASLGSDLFSGPTGSGLAYSLPRPNAGLHSTASYPPYPSGSVRVPILALAGTSVRPLRQKKAVL